MPVYAHHQVRLQQRHYVHQCIETILEGAAVLGASEGEVHSGRGQGGTDEQLQGELGEEAGAPAAGFGRDEALHLHALVQALVADQDQDVYRESKGC